MGPLGLLSYRSVGGTPAVGSTKLRLNLIMRLEPGLRLPIVTHGCAPELRAQINAADKPEQKRLEATAEYKQAKKATEKCQKERQNVTKQTSATPTPRWLRECEPLFGNSMQEFLIKRTELDLYMLVTVMQGHLPTVFATVLGLEDREFEAKELLGGLLQTS